MYRLHGAIHAYGGTVSARDTADSVISALTPAAWYRNATDVVSSGGFASIWADYASSDKGLVLPGVNGNYASTPDSVPLSITGDIDIRVFCSLKDWSGATNADVFAGKWNNAGRRNYIFYIANPGALKFLYSVDGAAATVITATANISITNNTDKWVRVTQDVDNGSGGNDVKFYTSDDGSTWTQVGATVTTAATITRSDTTANLSVGYNEEGAQPLGGVVYRAIIKSGIDGTTVFDADFSAQAIGTASFTESSSNAATVTINASGAAPAHIGKARDLLQGTGTNQPAYAAGVFTFDGVDNRMVAATWTQVQPVTFLIIGKQVTWGAADKFCEGTTGNATLIQQGNPGSTPSITIGGASGVAANSNLAVETRGIVCAVYNGAASSVRVNNTSKTTGDVGSGNPGGFVLGGSAGGTQFGNITAEEIIIFPSALSDANQDAVITALNNALTVF